MIVTEIRIINGKEFNYTYSDSNMMICRDGYNYSEAYDPINVKREYIETSIAIKNPEEEEDFEVKNKE